MARTVALVIASQLMPSGWPISIVPFGVCIGAVAYSANKGLTAAVGSAMRPTCSAAPLSAKLLKHGKLNTYKGFPHGMPTTNADTINADLLAFIRG